MNERKQPERHRGGEGSFPNPHAIPSLLQYLPTYLPILSYPETGILPAVNERKNTVDPYR